MGRGAREAWLDNTGHADSRAGSAVAGPDAAVAQARAQMRWSEVRPAPRKLTPPGRAYFLLGNIAQKMLDRCFRACYTQLTYVEPQRRRAVRRDREAPSTLRGGDLPC